jgi:hypothetical protein
MTRSPGSTPRRSRSSTPTSRSLQKMKDVADVIASVGKVIQIVTEIASLIR